MKDHSFILSVLEDLRIYAKDHGLGRLETQLLAARGIASIETQVASHLPSDPDDRAPQKWVN